MGLIRMGPPIDLLIQLQRQFGLKTFIETGTFQGNTAVWASNYFEDISTIEFSEKIFKETTTKFRNVPNINFLFGDSRVLIPQIIPSLSMPSVFWLDSHWCGGHSYGEEDQCPLLDEIEEINKSGLEHFIFIDDARLFTSPPPLPNHIEGWPTIDQVIQVLQSKHEYYIAIFEDVIIAVPQWAKDFVADYYQHENTISWKEHGIRVRRGFKLIQQGIILLGRGLYANIRSGFPVRKKE